MYTILVNDDNTLYGTNKERIMQRSKLFDNLQFLVNPMYKGYDMSLCTVMLEYVLPVSKKYCTEILERSEEGYEEYLKYTLPFDTNITSEAGKIELQLTFAYSDLDVDGAPIQRVRKTSTTTITIVPIAAWSDLIPDSALSAIDQRLIKTDAQIKELIDAHNSLNEDKADDIVYSPDDNTLQLLSNGKAIGTRVKLECDDEGVPIVDLDGDFRIVEF